MSPQCSALPPPDRYEQAVAIVADAPDLPGMIIAKLLRPLTSRRCQRRR
jgi:hypothetical protein